ncbi:uncharacterized protein LOC128264531 [Drosophila gunungcola]|uniref:uncharacterized protein LOC128264531 n=1 Tax=Drosophila gunungcola TaxID=103775 RepID=UPI0022E224A2|nr:uncharacterized protein LOC128264531 [Drosophila gunungcola]
MHKSKPPSTIHHRPFTIDHSPSTIHHLPAIDHIAVTAFRSYIHGRGRSPTGVVRNETENGNGNGNGNGSRHRATATVEWRSGNWRIARTKCVAIARRNARTEKRGAAPSVLLAIHPAIHPAIHSAIHPAIHSAIPLKKPRKARYCCRQYGKRFSVFVVNEKSL